MASGNSPAFPEACGDHFDSGLTMREYYAGQALIGLLSGTPTNVALRDNAAHIASMCVVMADALLKALSKDD